MRSLPNCEQQARAASGR